MTDAAGMLGVAMLLGWIALPLLAVVAHRASDPESRQRALTLALIAAAALLAVPWVRAWTRHVTALCFDKQTISAALSFAPSQYLLERAATPSVWVIAGAAGAGVIALGAVRMLALAGRLRRLLASSAPAPREIAARVRALAGERGLIAPEVRVSTEAAVPFVAGLRRKIIVLPDALLETLDGDGLELVLVHELVHLERRDVELSWLVTLARIPFLLHPVASWLAAEITLAREQAVDAIVARDDPRTYARVLIEVAACSCGKACPAAVAMSASSLEQRIDRLTTERAPRSAYRVGPVFVAALLLIGSAMLAPLRAESTTTRLITCEETELPAAPAQVLECVEIEPGYEACDLCEVCP